MRKSDIQKIIQEEIKLQRRRLFRETPQPQQAPIQTEPENDGVDPQPDAPVGLNPNKSKGIIAGAIKTLINSGALQGVDQSVVDALTADVLKSLDTTIQAKSNSIEDTKDDMDSDELEDEAAYSEEEEELDDQNQYDPELGATTSDAEEEEPAPEAPAEEPLFEAKKLNRIFKK